MNNGKKNGKLKPKVIDTGDSFPIIDDEKDVSDSREVALHGWKVSESGEYLGRWPQCPHCKKYIEKLKVRGVDVDLLDRDVVSPKGKINDEIILEKSKATKDETISLFDVRFLFFMARNYNVSSEISSRVPAQ